MLFCRNSNSDPCSWLVPDLVSTWITAPPACANSASKLPRRVLHSFTESMLGLTMTMPSTGSLLSVPSIMKLVEPKFCPLLLI